MFSVVQEFLGYIDYSTVDDNDWEQPGVKNAIQRRAMCPRLLAHALAAHAVHKATIWRGLHLNPFAVARLYVLAMLG